jgi:hypothetical protein
MLSMSSRIVIRIDFIASMIIVSSDKVRKIMSDTKKRRIALHGNPPPRDEKNKGNLLTHQDSNLD